MKVEVKTEAEDEWETRERVEDKWKAEARVEEKVKGVSLTLTSNFLVWALEPCSNQAGVRWRTWGSLKTPAAHLHHLASTYHPSQCYHLPHQKLPPSCCH